MKIFISADMEGISGVATKTQLIKESEYQRFRKLMTEDINAAIEGAFIGGATEVLVVDGHANMSNIIIESLDKRAKLISGSNRVMCQLEGLDNTYDGIMFIGHHGKEGGSNETVINHSLSSVSLQEIKIDGEVVGETEMNAKVADYYGVPSILASGDQAYCNEIKQTLPNIEVAEVKKGIDRYAAELIHPEKAHKIIKEQATKAMKKIKEIQLKKENNSVVFELTFKSSSQALMTTTIPCVKLINPTTIKFTQDNIEKAYKLMWACVIIANSATNGIFDHINN